MSAPKRVSRVGRLSRLGIGMQVTLSGVLAFVAVLLVNWLAGRPGVRQRFDLTATASNTLSTATLGLIDRIEDTVRIDILYQPMNEPLTALGNEVIGRTEKLLVLIEAAADGKIDVHPVNLREEWGDFKQKHKLRGFENGLLVSRGEQRSFIALSGDIAVFNLGNPVQDQYVPPRVQQFTAEEAIVEAILDVTQGDVVHAYFTFGYGEADALDLDQTSGMGRLADVLQEDGFKVHRWNYLEDGPLPEDCGVVVVAGPNASWPDDMYAEVLDHVERGGRMVVMPATLAKDMLRSDVPDLLEHFGLEVSEGRVMTQVIDRATLAPVEGTFGNELHNITGGLMSGHPMLVPIRVAGEGFTMPMTHQIRVLQQPRDGVAQTLFSSGPRSWLDSAPCNRVFDRGVDGVFGSFPLAATVVRAPMQEVPAPAGLEVVPEIRIVAFGSEAVFTNFAMERAQFRVADLAQVAFNWVVSRDHRITIPPRNPDLRFLPQGPEGAKSFYFVTNVAQFYLPGSALLMGILVWFLRSRGNRRRPSTSPEAVARDAA